MGLRCFAPLLVLWWSLWLFGDELEIIGDVKVTRTVASPFELKVPDGQYFAYRWIGRTAKLTVDGAEPWLSDAKVTVEAKPGVHTVVCLAHVIEQGVLKPGKRFECTFVVAGDSRPEPDPEPEPDTPDVSEVEEMVKKAVRTLSDQSTAQILKKNLETYQGKPTDDIAAVRKLVTRLVGKSFLEARSQKDWNRYFWIPVGEWLKQNADTTPKYLAAVKGIIRGLGSSPRAAGMVGKVHMLTRPNCPPCLRWKREVKPLFEKAGFEVVEETPEPGSDVKTPRFVINCQDHLFIYEDFLSVDTAKVLLGDRVKW